MKFHALMVVRDSSDVITETINHLLTWVDSLYLLDTGSIDGTWDIVTAIAAKEKRIVCLGRREIYFTDGLRGMLFEKARQHARDGDWFVRVDDDEFYAVLPPAFINERLDRNESVVYYQLFEFRLTTVEAELLRDWNAIQREREQPVCKRRRHYNIVRYTEPRMFRYRSSMQWDARNSFPFHAGLRAKQRIPIRHYPHRDPEQLRRRVVLRAAMTGMHGTHSDPHWTVKSWKAFLATPGSPELHHWAPGELLPEVEDFGHLGSRRHRLMQQCLYGWPVELLDRIRRPGPKEFNPKQLPEALQTAMIRSYGECWP